MRFAAIVVVLVQAAICFAQEAARPITPEEALKRVDQKVTVAMEVKSAGGNTAPCVECGQVFSTDDLLRYENSWVCAKCKPIFFQRVKEGAAPPASLMLWRSGRVLVMGQGASLPDRCVRVGRRDPSRARGRPARGRSPSCGPRNVRGARGM